MKLLNPNEAPIIKGSNVPTNVVILLTNALEKTVSVMELSAFDIRLVLDFYNIFLILPYFFLVKIKLVSYYNLGIILDL
jgi:hypothetical protein